jgi:hypothetical protein
VLRYTAPFMSFTFTPFTPRAAAFQGMGMALPAFTQTKRAMGARMITTITNAAT